MIWEVIIVEIVIVEFYVHQKKRRIFAWRFVGGIGILMTIFSKKSFEVIAYGLIAEIVGMI